MLSPEIPQNVRLFSCHGLCVVSSGSYRSVADCSGALVVYGEDSAGMSFLYYHKSECAEECRYVEQCRDRCREPWKNRDGLIVLYLYSCLLVESENEVVGATSPLFCVVPDFQANPLTLPCTAGN